MIVRFTPIMWDFLSRLSFLSSIVFHNSIIVSQSHVVVSIAPSLYTVTTFEIIEPIELTVMFGQLDPTSSLRFKVVLPQPFELTTVFSETTIVCVDEDRNLQLLELVILLTLKGKSSFSPFSLSPFHFRFLI